MVINNPSFLLFLLLLLLTTTVVSVASPPPEISPSSSATPATPQQDQQLNNIIDALIGAGDFNTLTNIISSSSFSLSATFFVPSDDFRLPLDPFTLSYHIVPQRLTFSDLCLLRPFSRLPTLLPGKSILVTNNSAANFTVDDSPLSHPDLYLTSSIAVHGIQNSLDYSVYGGPQPLSPPPPPPAPASRDFFVQEGEVTGGGNTSDAAAFLSVEFWRVFLVGFGVSLGCLC
ncbi:FAS1 domain containing protein [Melia azedarach]|uniref:FAS1 domain containing protein n=1 Tax=Melia azedarach TaxID=155640 RepID=A0ACC1WUC1_MELAZ|nr:FAS1 domain containing protein [Melia azedarach]